MNDDELHALIEDLEAGLRKDARAALTLTAQDFATAARYADELVAASFGVSRIGAMWRRRVGTLIGSLRRIARRGAEVAAEDLNEPAPPEADTRPVLDPYFDQVRTQLNAIGDRLSESAVTTLREGIDLGETPDELRARLLAVFADDGGQLGEGRARRIAMTSATSAFNAGVLAAAQTLTGPDRPLVKQWVSRLDSRTRQSHRDTHGQLQLLDEPFNVDGEELQYPGDPSGSPGTTINCRCVMRAATADRTAAMADPLTAADSVHTGAMIALIPSVEDAQRLALDGDGAEPADELHVTLAYLGEAADWTPEQTSSLHTWVASFASELAPITANLFGINHWNPNSDDPAWVWATGDTQGGPNLEDAHRMAWTALNTVPDRPELPANHTPWVAHTTAIYTAETWPLAAMAERLGPVTFDRVRIAMGGDHYDIPLADGVSTAPAPDSDFQSRMPQQLKDYWLRGPGAARIRWGTPGSFTRCVRALRDDFPENPEGLCANLYHEATGRWPGNRNTLEGNTMDDDDLAPPYEPPAVTWSTPDGTALAYENQQTGDSRVFTPGSLYWDGNGPWPLKLGHDAETELAGAIHGMGRDRDRIAAHGVLYPATDAGWEAMTLLAQGAPLGVSVDLDDVDYEVLVPDGDVAYKGRFVTASVLPLDDGYVITGQTEGVAFIASNQVATTAVARKMTVRIGSDGLVAAAGDGAWTDGAVVDAQKSGDVLMRVTRARIRGASLVTIPAFATARIVLDDPGLFADGHTDDEVSAAIKSTTDYDRVLRHVRRSNQPVGAARLAQFLKLPLAAAQRLLALAASRGEVVRLTRGLYTDKTTSARADHVMMDDMVASVTGSVDLPVAPRDTEWDGTAALRRMIEAGAAERGCAYQEDDTDGTAAAHFKLPYADVIDGNLTIIPSGVSAAIGALNGARGGVDIPQDEIGAVRARLEEVRAHVTEEIGEEESEGMQASAWKAMQDLPPMPAEWFREPTIEELPPGGPGVNYSGGRIWGWVAQAGEPHAGFAKKITVDGLGKIDLSHFLRQRFVLDSGETIKAGVYVINNGHHADGALCETEACAWDDSRTVAGIITVGMNARGLWFSGAAAPWLEDDWTRALVMAVQPSYHLKKGANGQWQLRAVLGVPVPGHSSPLTAAALKAVQLSLTAAATAVEASEALKVAEAIRDNPAAFEEQQAATQDVTPHDIADATPEAGTFGDGYSLEQITAAVLAALDEREARKAAEAAEFAALVAEADLIYDEIAASAAPEESASDG